MYYVASALFCSSNVPGTIFRATHQVKAIEIQIVKADLPSGLFIQLTVAAVCIYSYPVPKSHKFLQTKSYPPIPTFIYTYPNKWKILLSVHCIVLNIHLQ